MFPLRPGESSFDRALLARMLLALGMAGSVAGFIMQAVSLMRALIRGSDTSRGAPGR